MDTTWYLYYFRSSLEIHHTNTFHRNTHSHTNVLEKAMLETCVLVAVAETNRYYTDNSNLRQASYLKAGVLNLGY